MITSLTLYFQSGQRYITYGKWVCKKRTTSAHSVDLPSRVLAYHAPRILSHPLATSLVFTRLHAPSTPSTAHHASPTYRLERRLLPQTGQTNPRGRVHSGALSNGVGVIRISRCVRNRFVRFYFFNASVFLTAFQRNRVASQHWGDVARSSHRPILHRGRSFYCYRACQIALKDGPQ